MPAPLFVVSGFSRTVARGEAGEVDGGRGFVVAQPVANNATATVAQVFRARENNASFDRLRMSAHGELVEPCALGDLCG